MAGKNRPKLNESGVRLGNGSMEPGDQPIAEPNVNTGLDLQHGRKAVGTRVPLLTRSPLLLVSGRRPLA